MTHHCDPEARRESIKNHIVEVATQAFHRQGIKSVTMDDIAHSLSMSKRTLYQLFSDKEELLLACTMKHEMEERKRQEQLSLHTDNVLDFLLGTFAFKMQDLDEITPSFFADLIKYPRVVAYFEKINKEREALAVDFLNKGISQGFFRTNVNFHIVYCQLAIGLPSMVGNETLNQYSQRELFVNTVIPYIRGCATLKGIEIIDKFMDKYDTQIGL